MSGEQETGGRCIDCEVPLQPNENSRCAVCTEAAAADVLGAFTERELKARHSYFSHFRDRLLQHAQSRAEGLLQGLLGCGKCRNDPAMNVPKCGQCSNAQSSWHFLKGKVHLERLAPGLGVSPGFGPYDAMAARRLLGDCRTPDKSQRNRALLIWLAAEAAALVDYGLSQKNLRTMTAADQALFGSGYFDAVMGDPAARQRIDEKRAKGGRAAAEKRHREHQETKVKPYQQEYLQRLRNGERSSDIIRSMARAYKQSEKHMRDTIKPRALWRDHQDATQ